MCEIMTSGFRNRFGRLAKVPNLQQNVNNLTKKFILNIQAFVSSEKKTSHLLTNWIYTWHNLRRLK